MCNKEKLLSLIDDTMKEIESLVATSDYQEDEAAIKDLRKVLMLLLNELAINEVKSVNVTILRAMHDIGMSAYKDFENTEVEKAINKVNDCILKEYPPFKKLKPLRSDFRKEFPL